MRLIVPLILLTAVSFSGCVTRKVPAAKMPVASAFIPARAGTAIHRVALLPLCHQQGAALTSIEESFAGELNKTRFFEVVPISRTEMETLMGERQISSVQPLPSDLLQKLRAAYGVDGVLFTDVTQFSAYRPVSLGIRAKLVDAQTGEIRWAFDTIYDSSNPVVASAARKFQTSVSRENLPLPTDGSSVLLSPARFAKFVASQTYATLH